MIEPAVPSGRRRGALRGLVVAAAVAVGVLAGPAAAAHGGETTVEVVSRTPAGAGAVAYDVRLQFEDGHPVEGAAVTAVAELADGTSVGPIEMAAGTEAGRYVATLRFPAAGSWTVRFTSADPEVTSSVEELVEASSPPTTVADEADEADEADDAETTTTAPAPPTSTSTDPVDAAADDDSSTSTGLWVALGVVAAVVLAGTFLITRRGKRDDS